MALIIPTTIYTTTVLLRILFLFFIYNYINILFFSEIQQHGFLPYLYVITFYTHLSKLMKK